MNKKKTILALLLTILLSAFLYRDSFSAYFFQDDWFTLKISNAKSFTDILNFFKPRQDIIYYRPLGMQLPFFILQNLFDLNPLPFHLLTFFTHVANIILVFLIVRLLVERDKLALLAAFFYGTSTTHYTPFFWSSTYPFILGPTMFFLAFFLFLRKKFPASFAVFFLGIFVNEIVFVLPFVQLFYLLLFQKKGSWKTVTPFFLTSGIFAVGRFLLFPLTLSSDYQIAFGKHLLQNMEAYIFWSFSLPEEMKAQLVRFFMVNPQFIREFKTYFAVFAVSLSINVFLLCVLPLKKLLLRKLEKKDRQMIIFGGLWFLAALSPVVFFSNHVFSYYLPVPLLGLLFILSVNLKAEKLPPFFIYILLVNWLTVSFTTIQFNSQIHWAYRRAKIARTLVSQVRQLYPATSPGQVIFVSPSSENKLALNGQDGLRVVYNNDTILTVYGFVIDRESL